MLTARKAFDASSTPGLIGAILRDEAPSIAAHHPAWPPSLDRLIRTCLAKNPADRFASMHDVAIALDWIAHDLQVPAQALETQTSKPLDRRWLPAMAGVLVAAAVTSGYWYGRSQGPSTAQPSTYRYEIPLPEGRSHWAGIALAPEGRRLAVVTQGPTPRDPRLWIRDLGTSEWQLVSGAGDEIPRYPFWSPNGRSLAFFMDGKLVRVDPPGVAPIPICDAPDARGGIWLSDDTIVFAPTPQSGLMRVSASGGTPERLVDRREDEAGLKFPVAAGPGRLLFWAQHRDPRRSEIRLLRVTDPLHATVVVQSDASAAYDGATLYYLRSGALIGQPFDAVTGRLEGAVSRVDVDQFGQSNVGALPVSAVRGHLAVANRTALVSQLRWVDSTGRVTGDLGERSSYGAIDIAPNGRRVAVERLVRGEGGSSVWIVDVETGAMRRAVDGDGEAPVWAPDSRHLAFRSLRGTGGNGNLYEIDADSSSATAIPIYEVNASLDPIGWAPDRGVFVLSNRARTDAMASGIFIHRPNGSLTPVVATSGTQGGRLSPDGAHIAYQSSATGTLEVVFDSFPSPGPQHAQASRGGGEEPRWSADGRALFFASVDRLMKVPVAAGSPATLGDASTLFPLPSRNYAVHPDGQRFLVEVPISPASSTVRVTLNVRSR